MKIIALDTSKRCSTCKEVKAITEFAKDQSHVRDGLHHRCKSCHNNWSRLYWHANKEKMRQRKKIYVQNNKKKICLYLYNRRHNDPLFRINGVLRAHARRAKSKFGLKSKTAVLLGCSWEFAHAHLVQTAINRYGSYSETAKYHVDHILPLGKATNAEDAVKRCHISNLQYLTPEDNMAKGARLDWEGDLCL